MAGGDGNAYPRKRFLADMTLRRATVRLPLFFRHVFMGTLADTIFFMRCAKS